MTIFALDINKNSHKDKVCVPQIEKGWKWAEGLVDVRVVTAGLGDGGSEFGVAEGSDHGHEPAQNPNDKGETN